MGQASIIRKDVTSASVANKDADSVLIVAVLHALPLTSSLLAAASFNAALGSTSQEEFASLVSSIVPNVSAGLPAIVANMATSWSTAFAFQNALLELLACRTAMELQLVGLACLPAIDVAFNPATVLNACLAIICILFLMTQVLVRESVLVVVCSREIVVNLAWLDAWLAFILLITAAVATLPCSTTKENVL